MPGPGQHCAVSLVQSAPLVPKMCFLLRRWEYIPSGNWNLPRTTGISFSDVPTLQGSGQEVVVEASIVQLLMTALQPEVEARQATGSTPLKYLAQSAIVLGTGRTSQSLQSTFSFIVSFEEGRAENISNAIV